MDDFRDTPEGKENSKIKSEDVLYKTLQKKKRNGKISSLRLLEKICKDVLDMTKIYMRMSFYKTLQTI